MVQYDLSTNEATITPGIQLTVHAVGEMSSYTSGWARWEPLAPHTQYRWERIAGSGVPAFHDTYVQEHLARQDFDLSQQASIELAITRSTPNSNGAPYHLGVELTLVTWGGRVLALTNHRCEGDVLFAQAAASPDRPSLNKVDYTITFKKVKREG